MLLQWEHVQLLADIYLDSYNVLPGCDGIVPVDVYVPGCPPTTRNPYSGSLSITRKN